MHPTILPCSSLRAILCFELTFSLLSHHDLARRPDGSQEQVFYYVFMYSTSDGAGCLVESVENKPVDQKYIKHNVLSTSGTTYMFVTTLYVPMPPE